MEMGDIEVYKSIMVGTSKGPLRKNNLHKIAIIFLSISLNMCFGCSKKLSHRDGPFEYPQHMFWLRNKKNNFQLRTFIWGACTFTFLLKLFL